MEIVSIVARNNEATFSNFYETSIKRWNIKTVNVSDKEPPFNSMVEKYNIGVKAAIENNLMQRGDIIIFAHEDSVIIDNLVMEKVRMLFESKPSVGVVGVVGANGTNPDAKHYGQFIVGDPANAGKGTHIVVGDLGFFDDALYVDDFVFFARSEIFFDGIMFEGEHDNFMMDFCIRCLEKGYRVAVADIMTVHASARRGVPTYNQSVSEAIARLAPKHPKYTFPLKSSDVYTEVSEIISVEI